MVKSGASQAEAILRLAGEAVAQEAAERRRQVQQHRQLFGVERHQDRTQHRREGADQDGGVQDFVLAIDPLRQE